MLDPALAVYIEGDGSRADLVEAGLSRADALRVAGLVDRAEYKRRQAPPGVKITTKAFGRDRRLPITNGFRGVSAAGGCRPFGDARAIVS